MPKTSRSATNETPIATFASIGIDAWLTSALRAVSITHPTDIQLATIPPALTGRPIIGSARTGSGKTLAFALPILQHWAQNPFGVFAVVLTPTRELAFQIADQFRVLADHGGMGLRLLVCVGGQDMTKQALEMSGGVGGRPAHIVVATPGRLADHLRSSPGDISLSRAQYVVMDEADRLLTPGFAPDLSLILDRASRSDRRVMMFTATLTDAVAQLRDKPSGPDNQLPFFHQSDLNYLATVQTLNQSFILTPTHARDAHLVALLQHRLAKDPGCSIMIFTARCDTAEMLRIMIQELAIDNTCVALHSKLRQGQRLGAVDRFRGSRSRVLIATDVASRGLDIPSVGLVVNYDVPRDAADYVHRVGRTARAGRGGVAVTLVTERDVSLVENIEASIEKKLAECEDVQESTVLELLSKVSTARRVAVLHLHDTKFGGKDEARKLKRAKADIAEDDMDRSSKKRI